MGIEVEKLCLQAQVPIVLVPPTRIERVTCGLGNVFQSSKIDHLLTCL